MSTFARCGAMLAPFVPLLVGRIWAIQDIYMVLMRKIIIFTGQLLWAFALAIIWRNIPVGWHTIAPVAGNLSQKTTRYGKIEVEIRAKIFIKWKLFPQVAEAIALGSRKQATVENRDNSTFTNIPEQESQFN